MSAHFSVAQSRALSRMAALDIAARLGIPVEAVGADEHWAYGVGDMDEGAACVWWRRYERDVVTGVTAGGTYPILAHPDPRGGDR